MKVSSLGGGRQSIYMVKEYPTDINIFADTKCEPEYVYKQLEYYDLDYKLVTYGDMMQDIIDYVDGKRSRVAQIPLWFAPNMPLMRQCSLEYKIAPIRKYLRALKTKIHLNIGISLDEISRIKESNVKYIVNNYPLINNKIGISTIIKWYKDNNLKPPFQSACVICPYHNDNYWRALKNKYPNEFAKAVSFDEKIRIYPKMKAKLYLHKSCRPLKDIDFDKQGQIQFLDLMDECDGMCGL